MTEDSSQFEVRRQLLQKQMLYEVGLALGESLDFAHVAEEVLHRAVAMVDARGGMLVLRASGSSDPEIVCEAGLGEAAAALLQQPEADAAWQRQTITQVSCQDGVARHVCLVPLRVRGDTLGLLVVVDKESRTGVSAFPESDYDLLDSFALQAGAALHNAQLHHQLQSAYDELRAAQEKVAQLEQLRALGDLAAEITHAMRHVLGLVVGHADSYLTFQGDAVAAMQSVLRAAEGGQGLIDRLSRVTRLGVGRERDLEDLNRLIQQAVEEATVLARDDLGEGESVEWEMQLGTDLPPTYLNPDDVRESFVNLFHNALQAMPEGGRLTVATRARDDRLLATLTDTGCGMPDEVRERVFEPFYTTRGDAGSGLGLSIVYRIVEDHGGTVSVASTLGVGTEVTVSLPILSSPPQSVEDADAPEDLGG